METVQENVAVTAKKTASPAANYISFEDFLKQYDGVRAEWFKGQVEVLMTNNSIHNEILSFLDALFRLYLGIKKIGRLQLAGISMYTGDEWPSREPDLMIVLNENLDRIKPTYFDGPADIVIEIVSPESVERDYGAKFEQYEAVGVKEYWRFDPIRREADVYVRGKDNYYHRAAYDSEGRVTSALLPGFTLDPQLLWRETLPDGSELIQLVQAMAGS